MVVLISTSADDSTSKRASQIPTSPSTITIARSERGCVREFGKWTDGINPDSVYNPIIESAVLSLTLSNPCDTVGD